MKFSTKNFFHVAAPGRYILRLDILHINFANISFERFIPVRLVPTTFVADNQLDYCDRKHIKVLENGNEIDMETFVETNDAVV